MPPTTQSPGKSKSKTARKRKGKARTAVSSDSSSSSDASSNESTPQPTTKRVKKAKQEKKNASPASSPEVRSSPADEELSDAGDQTSEDEDDSSNKDDGESPAPEKEQGSFSNYYLRKVTTAFAEDLDKIRNASDFSEASLPLLIRALQQSEGCFSAEERRAVERALNA